MPGAVVVVGALCRATGTHSWMVVGPIVILDGARRRVQLRCQRCACDRVDIWSRQHGGIEGRSYRRPAEYLTYLHSHNRGEARLDILSHAKEIKEITHASKDAGLRLVSNRQTRHRQSHVGARRRAK